jgi:damage-control phosphatase, subfamily I
MSDDEGRFALSRSILKTLSQEFYSDVNLGLMCNKIVESTGESLVRASQYYDPFKHESNKRAIELLPPAKLFIDKGQTDQEILIRACCLASASNIAPIGGPSETFAFQEVINILVGKNPLPIVIGDIFEAVKKAKQVLYVTDNAGEIGFDSLLISRLKEMGSKITLLVRENPFFEDATTEDASFFRLDRWVDDLLTVKGLFVPPRHPSSLKDLFDRSDLIISKGTGNFEALRGELEGKKAIFMLKVKCGPIAADTGMDFGRFIVKLDE